MGADAIETIAKNLAKAERDRRKRPIPRTRQDAAASPTPDPAQVIYPAGFDSDFGTFSELNVDLTESAESVFLTPGSEAGQYAGPVLTILQFSLLQSFTFDDPDGPGFVFFARAFPVITTYGFAPDVTAVWPAWADEAQSVAMPLIRPAGEVLEVGMYVRWLSNVTGTPSVNITGATVHAWGQPNTYPYPS